MLKVLKVENDRGQYRDNDGNRYNLIYGTFVVGPRANDFEEFNSLEQEIK